jgi:hypothetical protein
VENIKQLLNGHYELILAEIQVLGRRVYFLVTAPSIPPVPDERLDTDEDVSVLLVESGNQVRGATWDQPEGSHFGVILCLKDIDVVILGRLAEEFEDVLEALEARVDG